MGDDLALSVTHFPSHGLTYAIFYGCTRETELAIWERLRNQVIGAAASHPLLLPGIFVELEYVRQVKGLARTRALQIERRLGELGREALGSDGCQSLQAMEQRMDLWFGTTELKNGLQTWKDLLQDMEGHIDELAAEHFGDGVADDKSLSQCVGGRDFRKDMRQVGLKMKRRLRSIIHEYDEKIRECSMRVNGMEMVNDSVGGRPTPVGKLRELTPGHSGMPK
jgi:SpoVK/Ycf46/Vps4 family AAA+-type ATPase